MSTVSKRHRPCSRQAVPISETPSGPGKGLGEHGQHGGGEGHGTGGLSEGLRAAHAAFARSAPNAN